MRRWPVCAASSLDTASGANNNPASDRTNWWKVASPDLYEAVYELSVLVGVEWED